MHTVSEWLKGNYYSTNEKLVDHIILNQSVTVVLSSSNDFENEDIDDKILSQIHLFLWNFIKSLQNCFSSTYKKEMDSY